MDELERSIFLFFPRPKRETDEKLRNADWRLLLFLAKGRRDAVAPMAFSFYFWFFVTALALVVFLTDATDSSHVTRKHRLNRLRQSPPTSGVLRSSSSPAGFGPAPKTTSTSTAARQPKVKLQRWEVGGPYIQTVTSPPLRNCFISR